jgi:hypothetical protein
MVLSLYIFPIKILYAFLMSPMCATAYRSRHLILLDFVVRIFGEEYKLWNSYVILSVLQTLQNMTWKKVFIKKCQFFMLILPLGYNTV